MKQLDLINDNFKCILFKFKCTFGGIEATVFISLPGVCALCVVDEDGGVKKRSTLS